MPFVLFSFPKIDLRDAQGYGPAHATGQVAEATLVIGIINEQHDPKGLGDLANAADTAVRSWAPSDCLYDKSKPSKNAPPLWSRKARQFKARRWCIACYWSMTDARDSNGNPPDRPHRGWG